MRKFYNHEIILYYFQTVLRNSLDPDPASGFFWFRIEILARSGFGFNEYGYETLFTANPFNLNSTGTRVTWTYIENEFQKVSTWIVLIFG